MRAVNSYLQMLSLENIDSRYGARSVLHVFLRLCLLTALHGLRTLAIHTFSRQIFEFSLEFFQNHLRCMPLGPQGEEVRFKACVGL